MLNIESRLASSQQARSTLHASKTNPTEGSRRPLGMSSEGKADAWGVKRSRRE